MNLFTLKQELKTVLEQYPSLDIHGFNSPNEFHEIFENYLFEIYMVSAFLSHIEKRTLENKTIDSYKLKGHLENRMGKIYIPMGCVILAALLQGFKIYRDEGDLGCRFNFSQESLDKLGLKPGYLPEKCPNPMWFEDMHYIFQRLTGQER